MSIVFVTPPPIKPSEPGLSAFAAAELVRRFGGRAHAVDASIGWHRFALDGDRLQATLAQVAQDPQFAKDVPAFRRAVRSVSAVRPLQAPATYRDRKVYTSAVNHLEQALRLASAPFPGIQVGIANYTAWHPSLRPESRAGLAVLSGTVQPFDAYFLEVLIPSIRASNVQQVGISVTFQMQAPAAFRLARLLRDELPGVQRILGGPLVACWLAAEMRCDGAPFDLFDRVIAGTDAELQQLAQPDADDPTWLRPPPTPLDDAPLSVALDQVEWAQYLAPRPTVPAVLGRGCYWRKCTFCPDHLHPRLQPCGQDGLEAWLHAIADRFPDGAMLHFTDSALPPAHLGRAAEVIRRDRLPLQWRGFVRVERPFADPEFATLLAQGGCAMLQLGIETGSPRILGLLGKGGGDPDLSRRVLRTLHGAGIRSYVYLLFGVPTETDADREATLRLVEDEADAIHALNLAILNLPRRSPMHRAPEQFGITEVLPFHDDTDLSLYDDFRCDGRHPRTEARRWLDHRFAKSAAVRRIGADFKSAFKENHAWSL